MAKNLILNYELNNEIFKNFNNLNSPIRVEALGSARDVSHGTRLSEQILARLSALNVPQRKRIREEELANTQRARESQPHIASAPLQAVGRANKNVTIIRNEVFIVTMTSCNAT